MNYVLEGRLLIGLNGREIELEHGRQPLFRLGACRTG